MNTNEINKSLQSFNNQQLLAFGYLCSTHLLNNYQNFSEKYNWGNVDILQNVLNVVREKLLNNSFVVPDIDTLIDSVDQEIPDTNDFPTILCSFALDAGNTVLETLNFLETNNSQRIYDIVTFCTDTIDMYIQERDDMSYDDPSFEKKIVEDELMTNELSRLTEIVNSLKQTNKFDEDTLSKLEAINRRIKRPNLNDMV